MSISLTWFVATLKYQEGNLLREVHPQQQASGEKTPHMQSEAKMRAASENKSPGLTSKPTWRFGPDISILGRTNEEVLKQSVRLLIKLKKQTTSGKT